ncbi:structure-specific recognition protein-domain-containing protein [Cantharellus anzutake]|uniref:structure-specific recognition protein-domain-containing protein n=1 Tax=Cantharellus anzutake TaxID=1750568 RepID=UPI001903AEF4|nr:structure-specific recognition protein-domain-containing protein [Cantharellus anzutake]KAF8321969.1 structure-specific recognition protein-domain-containing protein [Cantharellus anzutake]
MTTQFDDIYHGQSTESGALRLAALGLGWKSNTTETKVTIPAGDIKYMQWMRVARNFQLRVIMKDQRTRHTFDGFQREDHDRISQLVKQHFSVALETKEICTKGWNWGATDIQGSDLAFLVSNKTAFEIPFKSIANTTYGGKEEVTLEFALSRPPPPAGRRKGDEELVEIRLHIPGTHTRDADENGEQMEVDGEDEETSAAKAFHDMIKENADVGEVTGQSVATFPEVNLLTPRGRYDIDMFLDCLRLRGKTYEYKINYTSISRLFLLPRPDDMHILLVLGLDPPMRQGQTRYPFFVLQFSRDDEIEMELQMDEDTLKTYEGNLKEKYEQPAHEVVSHVLRGLSKKKITAPSGSFQSRDSHNSIKANALLFLVKPTTFIEYDSISSVVFSRVGGAMASARTFDIKVLTKGGQETTFSSINKEEHELIETFLRSKKLRIKNEMNEEILVAAQLDDSDDDMESDTESVEAPKRGPRVDADEDSEEDEDFEAESTDDGSPSESSGEEDGGAVTASDDSGDRDFMKKQKKKKKTNEGGDGASTVKKPKKKEAKKTEDDENPRPKKKAKKDDDN